MSNKKDKAGRKAFGRKEFEQVKKMQFAKRKYTTEEIMDRVGFGHSTVRKALKSATWAVYRKKHLQMLRDRKARQNEENQLAEGLENLGGHQGTPPTDDEVHAPFLAEPLPKPFSHGVNTRIDDEPAPVATSYKVIAVVGVLIIVAIIVVAVFAGVVKK